MPVKFDLDIVWYLPFSKHHAVCPKYIKLLLLSFKLVVSVHV